MQDLQRLAEDYLNQGVALFQQGRPDDAAAAFIQALQWQPGHVAARNNLGTVYLSQERLDDAISCFRQVAELEPNSAGGHFNLGVALEKRGRLDDAVASYEKAIQVDRQHLESWTNLGALRDQLGDWDGAIACYREILSRRPDYLEILNALGNVLLEQGQASEALTYIQQAIKSNGNFAQAHFNLGRALIELGRREEAVASFQQALRVSPDYAQARRHLDRLVEDNGPRPGTVDPHPDAGVFYPDWSQVFLPTPGPVDRWQARTTSDRVGNHLAKLAADFLPAGAAVLCVGGDAESLKPYLPPGCTFLPASLDGELPPVAGATHILLLGVLEFVEKAAALLGRLRDLHLPVLLSYRPAAGSTQAERRAKGWANHWTQQQFGTLLEEAGFAVTRCVPTDDAQMLWQLLPHQRKPLPTLRVLVLCGLNLGNFGDRLGYHLLNQALPPHAEVHYAIFNDHGLPSQDLPLERIDLLILGIGNSMYGPLLTDELLQILQRAPRALGIFGTQYRRALDRRRLARLLDRLEIWFARSEEDVLLYGRGRGNVFHLGDWLTSAFPMSQGFKPEPLVVGQEVWDNLPLDRTIQKIQSYRKVSSSRVHPLLCALTSAEQVAYHEQREHPSGQPSGKFASLFLDIFGRTFPEDEFFDVDREAVVRYKVKVQENIEQLRQQLASSK